MNIWLLLSMVLDVWPWLILQYMPFRGKLRYSVTATVLIHGIVLVGYEVGAAILTEMCSPYPAMLLRMGQILPVVWLLHRLVRDSFDRKAFVVGMLCPLSAFVGSIGAWCVSWMPWEAPEYLIPVLVRLGVTAALYPGLYRFWRWKLIPVLDGPNQEVCRSCWPLMALFTLATVLSMRPQTEIHGVPFVVVLVRLAIFLSMIYVNHMAVKIASQVERRIRMEEEVEKNWLLIGPQTEQYRVLTEKLRQAEDNRSSAHFHLSAIRALAESDGAESVKTYIDNLLRNSKGKPPVQLCENRTANAILSYYAARSDKEKIALELQAEIPQDLGINGTDLCIVIGNLFENAIEASLTLPAEQREIRVGIRTRRSSLEIHMHNRFAGRIRQENGKMLSAKRDFLQGGAGILSVCAVADQYDGELQIRHDKGEFSVDVILQESDEKYFGKNQK